MWEILQGQNDQVSPTNKLEWTLRNPARFKRHSNHMQYKDLWDLIQTNQLLKKLLNMWEILTLAQYLVINTSYYSLKIHTEEQRAKDS